MYQTDDDLTVTDCGALHWHSALPRLQHRHRAHSSHVTLLTVHPVIGVIILCKQSEFQHSAIRLVSEASSHKGVNWVIMFFLKKSDTVYTDDFTPWCMPDWQGVTHRWRHIWQLSPPSLPNPHHHKHSHVHLPITSKRQTQKLWETFVCEGTKNSFQF